MMTIRGLDSVFEWIDYIKSFAGKSWIGQKVYPFNPLGHPQVLRTSGCPEDRLMKIMSIGHRLIPFQQCLASFQLAYGERSQG